MDHIVINLKGGSRECVNALTVHIDTLQWVSVSTFNDFAALNVGSLCSVFLGGD